MVDPSTLLTATHWLGEPVAAWLPTANRGEALWLGLSTLGLVMTSSNLRDARRVDGWRRRLRGADPTLQELSRSHVEKAWTFWGIDVVCVAIGIAAVTNWGGYAATLLLGLLTLRLLLPVAALRDLWLRRRLR